MIFIDSYSLSDLAAITRNNTCTDGMGFGGGGNWLAWILLFALFGGNGFGFGGNRGNVATTEELSAGFNFAGINNKLNEIVAGQANINQNLSNAICQLGYQQLQNISTLEAQLASCCCSIERGIDSVKFDMANYAAAINANTTAVGQKVLDKLCAMEMAQKDATIAQQGQRIGQLELQSALCGIPRINPYGYGVYAYPTFGAACGCGSNI